MKNKTNKNKSDIFRGFFICKNILNKIIMTTTLTTSCSENTMVLSARRGVSACMYFLIKIMETKFLLSHCILLILFLCDFQVTSVCMINVWRWNGWKKTLHILVEIQNQSPYLVWVLEVRVSQHIRYLKVAGSCLTELSWKVETCLCRGRLWQIPKSKMH